MNLKQAIENEIAENKIQPCFEVSDLLQNRIPNTSKYKIGGQNYERISITTNLNNFSIGPAPRKGHHVQNGQKPWFIKHSDGKFSIFNGKSPKGPSIHPARSFRSEKTLKSKNPNNPKATVLNIATEFVNYIRNKPFRIMLNSRGKKVKREWFPASGPAMGWLQRLNSYEWDSKDWVKNSAIINSIIINICAIKSMTTPNAERCSEVAYNKIIKWGNPKGKKLPGKTVYKLLNDVWSGKITTVDSTITKLYAFAEPDNFVIYDSRVATAIVSIAEDIFRMRSVKKNNKNTAVDTVSEFREVFNRLGTYKGAGGTRDRGVRYKKWPKAYKKVDAQLQANELCKAIRDVLNNNEEDDKSDWTLREVEAVLFMEGY